MKTTKFKPSEVGPIPVDWEVKPFSECFTLMRNNTYSRDCLTDLPGSVSNVHYGDVLIRYGAVLDFEKDSVPYLKSGVKPNKDLLKDGDLIFADTAEDETSGKAVEVQGVRPRMAVAGLHTVACRPQDEIFAPRYLGYYINSAAYHNQLLPLMTGTKVTSISRTGFVSTHVAIPPKSEQKAIAEALSDVDALLAAMTKLIEKKRAIKQGAMQELLTGKKRLAGFSGAWVEKRLGDIVDFYSGIGFPLWAQGSVSGSYPFCKVSDQSILGNEVFLQRAQNYVSESVRLKLGAPIVPMGSIAFAKVGAALLLNRRRITAVDLCLDNNMMAIKPHEDVDEVFLYFKMLGVDLGVFSQEGVLPSVNHTQVGSVVIGIPPTLAEQKAIAAVLSDMDAEIAALEAKRAKYERIKQGMMQELLTGRVRLG